MAKAPEETTTASQTQLTKMIRELGVPMFFAVAFGWVMITYWIGPQAELIKSQAALITGMTESNNRLGVTFDRLADELTSITASAAITNEQMAEAFVLMKDVPAQREEQLNVLKRMADAVHPDVEFRKVNSEEHQKIMDELNKEP